MMAQCDTCVFAEWDTLGIDGIGKDIIVGCNRESDTPNNIFERMAADEEYHCNLHITKYNNYDDHTQGE